MFKEVAQCSAELLRVGGDDLEIVNAARVSYAGRSNEVTSDDEKLIDYLMRNEHTTPFEMPEVLFRIKAPIFVTRQFMRHRTWSYNEVSLRYVDAPNEYYVPDTLRGKPKNNKQGSSGIIEGELSEAALESFLDSVESSIKSYEYLQYLGVANEMARMVLPVCQMTEFYAKVDLRNFLHFLKLRMDPHAQQEIRELANQMHDAVQPYFPVTFKAWSSQVLKSSKFTENELEIINSALDLTEVRKNYDARTVRVLFEKLGTKE